MDNTIIISGANGFLGSFLVNYFHEKKHYVIALIHHQVNEKIDGVEYREWEMDSISENIVPANALAFIHAAYIPYSKNNKSEIRNLDASKKLLDVCIKKNVRKFIYLSSFSALPEALSHYGRNKFEIEKIFDENRDLVLRPALVIGDGGLYSNIVSLIKNYKFIPLISGGIQQIQTLKIDNLAEIINAGILKNICGCYNISDSKSFPIKQLYQKIAKEINRKVVFISIPYNLSFLLIKIIEKISRKPKITIENLLGLKQMQVRETSDLKIFEIDFESQKTD